MKAKKDILKGTGTLLILLAFFFCSCEKQEDPEAAVSYKVIEKSGKPSGYKVIYRDENNTVTEGNLTSTRWTSRLIRMKHGDYATLTVDGGSGTGSFDFSIIVNGTVQANDHFDNPQGPKTISFQLIY
jgi:hypothetical protein